MSELIVLMRAVNVGGRKLPMAELRELCCDLGFDRPETYIQSGNLLIGSPGSIAEARKKLAAAIEKTFGFEVPLIVRTANKWRGYVDGNPFVGDANVADKMLHLLLADRPPPAVAAEALQGHAQAGERVRIAGDALWIDYASGVADSKLTPARIDKAFGASATGRNLRTVLKLQAMIEERAG